MLDRKKTVESSYLIPGWCWPVELGAIYDVITQKKPRTHVEVGSFCGKSLFVAAGAMPVGGRLITIEPFIEWDTVSLHMPSIHWWKQVFNTTLDSIKNHRPDLEILHLQMKSSHAAIEVLQADSVYIDACHEYAEVSSDIQEWGSVVGDDGLLWGHDYCASQIGVVDAVNMSLPGEFQVLEDTRIWVRK